MSRLHLLFPELPEDTLIRVLDQCDYNEDDAVTALLAMSDVGAGSSAVPPTPPPLPVARQDTSEVERQMLETALAVSRIDVGLDEDAMPAPNAPPPERPFQLEDGDYVHDDDDDDEVFPHRARSRAPDSVEGIWTSTFITVPTSHHPTLCHGRGDKVLLPTAALAGLTGALKDQKGTHHLPHPLVLCLAFGEGSQRRTKLAGVLEFSAAEGTILLPTWLLEALGAPAGAAIEVTCADVPRATSITLRPIRRLGLSRGDGELDTRVALETGLWGVYTCLCSGDTITINTRADGDSSGEVRVEIGEVRGGAEGAVLPAVCIVDIEQLVCDLGESVENERERLAQEQRQAEETQRLADEAERRRHVAAQEAAAAEAARAAAAAQAAQFERARVDAQAHAAAEANRIAPLLPPEPPAGPAATAVRVQLPAGRIQRRFASSTPLQLVRLWVEANLDVEQHEARHGQFELVSSVPGGMRFVASGTNEATTLEEAGLHPSVNFHFDARAETH